MPNNQSEGDFPIKNNASYFEPGRDNRYGTNKDGGAKTSSGTVLNSEKSYSATPIRNELKRVLDILHERVDPRYTTTYDVGLSYANGKYAVDVAVDEGGLDKEGRPTADKDLTKGLSRKLGMEPVNGGLNHSENFTTIALGSLAPIRTKAEVGEEKWKQLTEQAEKLEQEMNDRGRFPINRDENNPVPEAVATNFRARLEAVRSQLYPLEKDKIAAASEIVEKINNGEAKLSDLRPVLATEFRPDLLEDKTIAQVKMPQAEALAKSDVKQGAAHYAYDPKKSTKEQVEGTLTAGMQSQQAGESDTDYSNRKRNYMSDMLAQMPPEQKILFMVLALIFSLIDPEGAKEMFAMIQGEGGSLGYGSGSTNIGADNARYNGKGVIGGRVKGLTEADGRTLELPRFDPEKYKTSGEYFAACAKKFEGMREHGSNSGEFVRWVMANTGVGEGSPWCAGFASKMYEGTGLYNYTASALNFAEQGLATNSFREGASHLNNISVGDTMVFSRGGDHGHVGIVIDVKKDGDKVTAITTLEGNSTGGAVSKHTRTPQQLANMNSSSFSYLGYVDIKDREQKLIDKGVLSQPIIKTLTEKYAVGQTNEPEQTAPIPAPGASINVGPLPHIAGKATSDRAAAIAEQTAAYAGNGFKITYEKTKDTPGVSDEAFRLRANAINGAVAYVEEQRKLHPDAPVIVIDSGHGTNYGGSHDTGTEHGGLSEERIVSNFSGATAERARAKGIIVVETKDFMGGNWGGGEDAKWFSLTVRKEIAGHVGASSFVSIHADEGPQEGLKTYFYGDSRLAGSLNSGMGGIHARGDEETGVGKLKVLRTYSQIPSALVEIGSIETADKEHLDFSTEKGKAWRDKKAEEAAQVLASHAQIVAIIKDKKDERKSEEKAEEKVQTSADIDPSQVITDFTKLPPSIKRKVQARLEATQLPADQKKPEDAAKDNSAVLTPEKIKAAVKDNKKPDSDSDLNPTAKESSSALAMQSVPDVRPQQSAVKQESAALA